MSPISDSYRNSFWQIENIQFSSPRCGLFPFLPFGKEQAAPMELELVPG
jgi:hypothetical protein